MNDPREIRFAGGSITFGCTTVPITGGTAVYESRPGDSPPDDVVETVSSLESNAEISDAELMLGAMHCPTPQELADVVSIGLPEPRSEEVLIHLGICEACYDHARRIRAALCGYLGKPEKYLPRLPEIVRYLTPEPPLLETDQAAEKSPFGAGRKARRAHKAQLRRAKSHGR